MLETLTECMNDALGMGSTTSDQERREMLRDLLMQCVSDVQEGVLKQISNSKRAIDNVHSFQARTNLEEQTNHVTAILLARQRQGRDVVPRLVIDVCP